MNKKILLLLGILTVSASVIVGCSKATGQEDPKTSENIMQSEVMENEATPSDSNQIAEDTSEVIGKVEEIKDFMFIVTDDANVSYAFTFEEKPEDLDQIAVGDHVIVTYTGTISEVDPFVGEILAIELFSDGSDDLEANTSGTNQNGDLRYSGITDPYANPEVKLNNLTSEEDQSALRKDLEKAGIKESYIKD